MGAPLGNTNSKAENRLWGNTIRRAATQDAERLRRIAEKLFEMAEAGDIQAMKEIGDRTDGKPHQTLDANVTGNLAEVLAGIGRTGDDPPVAG